MNINTQSPSFIRHHFQIIDSTNAFAKRNYKTFDLKKLQLVTASEQTAGLGTHGKSWISPKDVNIYATLVFSLPTLPFSLSTLAQFMTLSIAEVLCQHHILPSIKWPNDLMIDHQKIGGVLCEIIGDPHENIVFLGFGLNVNMDEESCLALNQPASSLFVKTGVTFSTEKLLFDIVSSFSKSLPLYIEKGFEPFLSSYLSLMIYKNYPVYDQETFLGLAETVTTEGLLVVSSASEDLLATSRGSIKVL